MQGNMRIADVVPNLCRKAENAVNILIAEGGGQLLLSQVDIPRNDAMGP